jgi:hypothetical protein
VCHAGKADPSVAVEKVAFFNSMGNENAPIPLPPAPKGTASVKPAASEAKPAAAGAKPAAAEAKPAAAEAKPAKK